MTDDELERMRLENELRDARRREHDNARGTRFVIFLAIWLMPPLTISFLGEDEKRSSLLFWWALGVPIAFIAYCRLNKISED
jgi:hypothetical protein